MKLMTALELKKALILLEKELGVPVQKLGSLINLFSEDAYGKLMEASDLWNEFESKDLDERAKMMGYTLKEKES